MTTSRTITTPSDHHPLSDPNRFTKELNMLTRLLTVLA
ncbi:MAG: hypothetical protein ACI9U2_001107, partial [Bradymonadia bacterium]